MKVYRGKYEFAMFTVIFINFRKNRNLLFVCQVQKGPSPVLIFFLSVQGRVNAVERK
jgi:hypothetical protein